MLLDLVRTWRWKGNKEEEEEEEEEEDEEEDVWWGRAHHYSYSQFNLHCYTVG